MQPVSFNSWVLARAPMAQVTFPETPSTEARGAAHHPKPLQKQTNKFREKTQLRRMTLVLMSFLLLRIFNFIWACRFMFVCFFSF